MNNVKWLTLSDIHLGHKKTETTHILKNLYTFFQDFKGSIYTDLDFIFIAGDLFDGLLDNTGSDTELHDIKIWLSDLMKFCYKYNIALRILEGTPSHDWKQSSMAVTIFEILDSKLDFKYINNLHIELHSKMSILYIPDEWTNNNDLTFKQVQELLESMSMTSVDVAIMHGAFEYQLPQAPAKIQKHKEDNYTSIVKYGINIGHIHKHSVNGKIVAQGSFDRLAHGEEEKKGAVLCSIINDEFQYYFIENKGAKIYKTVTLKTDDVDSNVEYLTRVLSKYPEQSYIRLKGKKNNIFLTNLDEVKRRFPFYIFSKTSEEEIETNFNVLSNISFNNNEYRPISITQDNIEKLLMEQIVNKYSYSDVELQLASNIIKGTLNGR